MEKKSSEQRVAGAAGLVMAAMAVSRVLGYARDVIIYSGFGQNSYTDAYNAAFSIPDLIYYLLVGGALSSAFIPVFSGFIARGEEDEAWETASVIFNIIMVMLTAAIAFGFLFTPGMIDVLVPGFDEATKELTVFLTRIMFFQSFFMCLNGISQGILHSYKHFRAPAIGSVLYNLGIIVVGVVLSSRFGIAGFSVGVVAGAFMSFAVQFRVLKKIGIKYTFSFDFRKPGVKRVFYLIIPVFIGLSVTHLNLFVNQYLASGLQPGMLSSLKAAQRIMQLPIGIFGVAVAIAVFPTLTEYAARNEMKEFIRSLSSGVRTVVFLTVPSAAGLIALRYPVVRTMFEQNMFTANNTEATAYALLFYSLGLVGYSVQQVLNRAFYAMEDTVTPVIGGVLSIAANIILNFVLIKHLGHGGLALAYSAAGLLNMLVLLVLLRRKAGLMDGRNISISFLKTLAASLAMGIAVRYTSDFTAGFLDMGNKYVQILHLTANVTLGAAIFVFLARFMKMEEYRMAVKAVLKR